MRGPPFIQECFASHAADTVASLARNEPGVMLLHSQGFERRQARFSFVVARPFLTMRSYGSRCELSIPGGQRQICYGNPWRVLESLMGRFELLNQLDLPFPLGGCFGFWGYDLKNFTEPRVSRRAINDLERPDCHLGFYDSLVAFDHLLSKCWIVSTGLTAGGAVCETRAKQMLDYWNSLLHAAAPPIETHDTGSSSAPCPSNLGSTWSRETFMDAVSRAQQYIRRGDVYQVNLSHRLSGELPCSGWDFFTRLSAVSPAPFSAWFDCGDFQLASSSPELFLRLSGFEVRTRPIKGTRPRSADAARDAQLSYELQTSPKETAELVMITDLLRNDLGKVCEFGSVHVPELMTLERYAHVQHLVSTVAGRLRPGTSHAAAMASTFPGGSITGAPKIRAMEIIDELEPVTRGPYTGALGYLGFNRESQLSIIIRTAVVRKNTAWFHTGAGIVADSDPAAEYDETLAKAAGFLQALACPASTEARVLPIAQSINT